MVFIPLFDLFRRATKKLIKIFGNNDGVESYNAPAMFEQALKRGPHEMDAAYKDIQKELVQLAKDKKLYLTDILNQPTNVWQMVGNIILGQRIENNAMRTDVPVPDVLKKYTVKIKKIIDGEKWGVS